MLQHNKEGHTDVQVELVMKIYSLGSYLQELFSSWRVSSDLWTSSVSVSFLYKDLIKSWLNVWLVHDRGTNVAMVLFVLHYFFKRHEISLLQIKLFRCADVIVAVWISPHNNCATLVTSFISAQHGNHTNWPLSLVLKQIHKYWNLHFSWLPMVNVILPITLAIQKGSSILLLSALIFSW